LVKRCSYEVSCCSCHSLSISGVSPGEPHLFSVLRGTLPHHHSPVTLWCGTGRHGSVFALTILIDLGSPKHDPPSTSSGYKYCRYPGLECNSRQLREQILVKVQSHCELCADGTLRIPNPNSGALPLYGRHTARHTDPPSDRRSSILFIC
jgi:hypothetical protein